MKLPSVYTDLCSKQVFENATSGQNTRFHSVVNSSTCKLQLPLTVPVPAGSKFHSVTCEAQFTGVHDN
jgi:hypothetical protein